MEMYHDVGLDILKWLFLEKSSKSFIKLFTHDEAFLPRKVDGV